jgi:hypothetical protein
VVIELVDLPVLRRAVESDGGGAFEGGGDGFLWLKATVTSDFEGVHWTRIARGDFEVLAKFDKTMRMRPPLPPGEILGLVPAACEGLRGFDVEVGSSCGGTVATELEKVLVDEKGNKDRRGRAVLDAALRLSNTNELGASTVIIFLAINERLRRATSLADLSVAGVTSQMRELLGNLWAYAQLLVEALRSLRPSVDEKGEHRTSLCRGCMIMRSTFDEFRNRRRWRPPRSSGKLPDRSSPSIKIASAG